ncbi:Hypothetical predicted protein [Olea europaea subsp. europaea]|uniref:Transmembrane protein n=1 Tax=Olea europaea subsp. europaea TaxID=158383 RepID=A0A8S0TK37_OLEEU|nr:Hypothetical predicted protein [Olea europaea subsp. europaea]
MAVTQYNWINIIFIFSIFFLLISSKVRAIRPLEGEQWQKRTLVIQSLPRGPIPPSGGNPCTYIPGRGGRGHCTLAENEGDFAVHVASVPKVTLHFAAASSKS